jgi:thiamine biosynthesis lipoprotein
VTRGGLVDLGGDLRVWGSPPDGDGWPVAVEDLRTRTRAALLWLASGAVATCTTLRRRWEAGGRSAHHLIDPSTGRPAAGELVSVTVVAAATATAEVLAKVALLAGTIDEASAVLEHHAAPGLLVPETGEPVSVAGFANLCWNAPEVG